MNDTRLAELEAFCRARIPVAAAMQLRFSSFDGEVLTLSAPLAANINHHGTVFGGSQYATAAIAGWGVIKLTLEGAGLAGDAVITHAEANYRRPVRGDFTLTSRLREPGQFLERCRAHRHVTVDADAQIRDASRVAMTVAATFYVTLHDPSNDPPPP